MENTIKLVCEHKPLMVAHRGVSGLEKENTMAAFVAAGNRSYFGIETDVHITKDKGHILIHDDTTGRVAETDVSVEGSDFAELRSIRVKDVDESLGRCDLYLPELSEYVKTCDKYGKIGVLELKRPMEKADIDSIIREIQSITDVKNIIFISFDFQNLVFVREILPKQTVQFLTDTVESDLLDKLTVHKMDLDIYYKCITKAFVEDCHAKGILVNCWTVNTKEEGQFVAACGVDFITSNILE